MTRPRPCTPLLMSALMLTTLAGLSAGAMRPTPREPSPDAIAAAVDRLGGPGLQTLHYGGDAVPSAGTAGADGTRIVRYTAAIDYPAAAMQIEIVRARTPVDAGSAGQIEERHIQGVAQTLAWDVPFAPVLPTPGAHRARVSRGPVVAPASPHPEALRLESPAADERRGLIWATPHGFLRAALANAPALRSAGGGTEVSFFSGKTRYAGFINGRHEVERVRVWKSTSSGELVVDTTYLAYATFGPIQFPTRILQHRAGAAPFELAVTGVQPNAPIRITVPDGIKP